METKPENKTEAKATARRTHEHKTFFSLRWTLFITYFCVGFFPLLIFSSSMLGSVEKYFVDERKTELSRQANTIASQILAEGFDGDRTKTERVDYYIRETSVKSNYRVLVTDATGTVISDSNNTDVNKTFLIPEVIEALENKASGRKQENGSLYVAVPIYNSETAKLLGAVLISAPTSDISVTVDGIGGSFKVLLAVIAAVVGAFILILSQMIVKPLKNLLQSIKRMAAGHLDCRAPLSDGIRNEITDLSFAFNNMAEQLEQLDITRQNFVSNVSHELKTPLSSMKVLSESVLLQTDLPKEVYIEFLQDINSEIDRMSNIISDLLNLVRMDQKVVPINFDIISLNTLLTDIVKRIRPLANNKSIELTLEYEREVVAEVDEMKMTLALSNLIENAVKYTNEGGYVRVSLDGDHQNAFIKVSDTGIGIAEEEQGKIFDRFYRVDKTRDRETGGTGLGLSITHSTVLIHNGSIKVMSTEGEGSTFLLRIPLRQPDSFARRLTGIDRPAL